MINTYCAEELRTLAPDAMMEIIQNLYAANNALQVELNALKVKNASLQAEFDSLEIKYDQQGKDMVSIARNYSDLVTERDALKKEKSVLEKKIQALQETLSFYARNIYASSSETMHNLNKAGNDSASSDTNKCADIPAPNNGTETTDKTSPESESNAEKDSVTSSTADIPVPDSTKDDDKPGTEEKTGNTTPGSSGETNVEPKPKKPRKTHVGPKDNVFRRNMKKLPERNSYLITAEQILELDERYGAGKWRIIKWEKTSHLEVIPRVCFVQNDYRPVIEYRQDGISTLMRFDCPYFFPHSTYSPSAFASLVNDKYVMGLPVYRQLASMERLVGDSFDRGNASRMLIRGTQGFLMPVYNYMKRRLLSLSYTQSDETPLQVLEGDASKVHYLWCHVTGELRPEDPQIVLFSFEKTRSTEHLRQMFSDGFVRVITSDCYVSYSVLEKEEENITISNCWVHVRRPFYYAFCILVDVVGIRDEKVLEETNEFKFLSILRQLFDVEKSVKKSEPAVRLEVRQTKCKPLVNSFFDLAKSIDPDNPNLTEKTKKALSYALNHEESLRRFLDDPNIPIDNSNCERSIRPVAVGRRNWLFADTFNGADAAAVYYSLTSTAMKNDADPFFYIKYLCERIPGGIDGPAPTVTLTDDFLESMMPWSQEYKAYEEKEHERIRSVVQLASDEKPVVAVMRAAATESVEAACR